MSDRHILPLLGHDLPAATRAKAQVYKARFTWSWTHACGRDASEDAYGYTSHAEAVASAVRHVRRCVG